MVSTGTLKVNLKKERKNRVGALSANQVCTAPVCHLCCAFLENGSYIVKYSITYLSFKHVICVLSEMTQVNHSDKHCLDHWENGVIYPCIFCELMFFYCKHPYVLNFLFAHW